MLKDMQIIVKCKICSCRKTKSKNNLIKIINYIQDHIRIAKIEN
jgi:hypothetical protein